MSILESTRQALGLSEFGTEFNPELILHINAALSTLNQNGVGKSIVVQDGLTTWEDFKDDAQTVGNEHFKLIPAYVFYKTKILFDPPPPSNVAFYGNYTNELLWRIREAYDT